MPLPAQAFGLLEPAELPAGSLFKSRGAWALRVDGHRGPGYRGFIMLSGERIGTLIEISPGTPRCVVVLPPFSWFPAVAEGATPGRNGLKTATLMLTATGPVIVCADTEDYDTVYLAFSADGARDDDYPQSAVDICYAEWSAELQHPLHPYESLGQLFAVDRRQIER